MGRKSGAEQVPKERKQMIMDMYEVGLKQKDICEYHPRPKSAVCNVVRREWMNSIETNNENCRRKPSSQNRLHDD